MYVYVGFGWHFGRMGHFVCYFFCGLFRSFDHMLTCTFSIRHISVFDGKRTVSLSLTSGLDQPTATVYRDEKKKKTENAINVRWD